MHHRERVVAALNHQATDRVPIDLGSTIVTTATRIAYQNLLQYLGLRREYLKALWEFEIKELPSDRFTDEYDLTCQKARA